MRGSRPHNPKADYIIIDGIWFYRENSGNHYYLGHVLREDGKKHPIRAHQYVWEKYNGKIPKGSSIHHIDKDPSNNDISNLRLMSRSSHQSLHALERSDEMREKMNTVLRPLACEWHGSGEGREWHKQHYEEYNRKLWNEKVTKTCEVCGKEYTTTHSCMKKSRFCSDNCKSKFRRMAGLDNETRICRMCGKEFVVNKHSRQMNCSIECGRASGRLKKIGVPRHHRSNP